MSNFRDSGDWDNVVDPITDDEVREWVAALRSGEYKQGKGQLKDNGGRYCCLGVEAEIHNLESISEMYLRSPDGNFTSCLKMPSKLQDDLANMNDGSAVFTDIADYLEKGFFPNEDKSDS